MALTCGTCSMLSIRLALITLLLCVSTSLSQDCGGTFNDIEGEIKSPSYPSNYSNNLNCIYIITGPPGHRITLNFSDFSLEDNYFCSYDFVEVRDGETDTAPVVDTKFCGSTLPGPLRSTRNFMRVQFRTDSSVNNIGFHAFYTAGVYKREMILLSLETKIIQVDIETESYIRIPIDNLQQPAALDYDPTEERIYWTDLTTTGIHSAFLNGSNDRMIRDLGSMASPEGLAIDRSSRLLVYTDAGMKVIGMMTLSGSVHRLLFDTLLDEPRAIVLDTRNGVLFWTDVGRISKIERANYDTSDRKTIVSTGLGFPNALAIDLDNNRLYWVDGGTEKLEGSNLDGSNRTEIYQVTAANFVGLALYNHHLYFTDWREDVILGYRSFLYRINTDGSNKMKIFSSYNRMDDVHVYSEASDKQEINGCGLNNGGCQYICIPLPNNRSKCACPDRQEWDDTQRACTEGQNPCNSSNGGCSDFCSPLAGNRVLCSCPIGSLLLSDQKSCGPTCWGNLTRLQGSIQSPQHPGNYSDNADCVYIIQQPDKYRITLTFQQFSLQGGYNCLYDFLEIRDGDSATSPLLHVRLCGEELPPSQRTTQNFMWIHFKSDSKINSFGFSASYKASILPKEFILTTFEDHIVRMDIETLSYIRIQIDNVTRPMAVDYDPVGDRIYWSDVSRHEVRSSFLNGSDSTLLRALGPDALPNGIAVDSYSRLLFYSDAGQKVIAMMSISAKGSEYSHRIVFNTNLSEPQAIVLDTMNGTIFWTDIGTVPKIERGNYDGTDRRTLIRFSLRLPNALAIDLKNNLLYWVDAGTDHVEVANLDGLNRRSLWRSAGSHFYGLSLYNNELYITNWKIISNQVYESRIYVLNTNGTELTDLTAANGQLGDIHIYSDRAEDLGSNACVNTNGGCSDMCIPLPQNTSKCLCPDLFHLSENGKTCISIKMATWIRSLVLLILWHFGGKSDALECGDNLTNSQGWIESPGYPNVYPNDIDCFYVISQPVGLRIFLNFTDFRLQGGLDCEHDYIEIRDGGSEESPILNTQVCGSVTPFPYKTTQHIMRIRFKTDSSVNYKGFRAFYKSGAFPNEFLLVTRENDILRVDIETLSFRTIPISAQRLMAIDYDPVTDRMYWTDADSKEIRSAFLNGTNDTLVHRLGQDSRPSGLALDDISRLIFYCDAGSGFIALMTMADFKHKNLIDTNLDQPMAIVLDKAHGFLFWTDLGSQPKIERALYDGSKRKILINTLLVFPTALALDTEGQRLFWMDAKMSKIESSDVDGGDRRRISQSFSPHFIGLVFYQSYLYITDRGQEHSDSGSFIHRLHVNNSMPEMLLNTDGRLMDIHIYSQNALSKGSRSCGLSNGGCSDICIPLPDNGTRCLCPDGYILDDLQKHCRQDYDACQENNGGCSHFCIQVSNKKHKCWCPEGLFLSVDNKMCSKVCVRNYTQLEGTLTSPGFPDNYPSGATCIYTIEVPISYRITLIFLDFWLEEDNFCLYDKVEVHDGASLTSPLLTRLFCGNSIPDTQRSTKNVMTIVFKTDRTNSFRGFNATYTATIVPKDILLIGGSRRLTRMDIETQSYIFVPLGQTRNTFSSIEYDPQEDRLYWTSGVQLQSAFLNGTDSRFVRSFGGDVKGMALDPTARKIFYTAIYNTMIGIMSLSTLTNEVLITTNLKSPLAIALHTRKKFIFWSDVYKTANIERANYDGSNRTTIFISSSASPSALAVDYIKNRLYWVDSSTGEVQCSSLDGINRTLVYKSPHNNIYLLTLCGNYIYIIGWYTANGRRSTQGELYRFNSIDNTTHNFKLALENIFSMHIYSENICIKDHEVTLSNLNLTSDKYSTPSLYLDSSSRFTKGILPSLTHSSKMEKITFETTTSVSATAPILTVSSAISKTTALTGHATFDPDVSDKVILTTGHTTFDPDASNNVTLTCNSSDLKVMEGFSWTASGEGQQRRETCTAFPSPHFVGLTYISCNISHVDRELRIHAFKLDLLQSSITLVNWNGSTSGNVFHTENTLHFTCVIKAGNFADEFVAFSCLCEVLSVVTISTTSTSDNWTTCVCTSVTSTTEWYGNNTTLQRDNNQNVIELGKPVGVSISGAAVAGGVAIAVIIVIIIIAIKLIWKKRKRLTHTCVYYHKGPQLLLAQDDVKFSLLKDTFTEQEDTKDSTTGSLARSSDLLS